MLQFLRQEWKFFVILFVVVAALAVVYAEYKQYHAARPADKANQPIITVNTAGEKSSLGEPQVVYVQGQQTHTKEVIYVPKEIDAKTGQLEKTDVQLDKKANIVYVKVNGKEFEVPAEVNEDAKFDKGKLLITDQTEMRINITAPKPSFNLGLGWSKEGPAAQFNGPLYKNVSWWVYGDKKNIAGGLQFPIAH